MNLTETLRLSNEISQQLFPCTSEDQVECVFKSFNISAYPEKTELLQLCMGVKSYSTAPHDSLTPEQQYQDMLLIFLDGSWRFLA